MKSGGGVYNFTISFQDQASMRPENWDDTPDGEVEPLDFRHFIVAFEFQVWIMANSIFHFFKTKKSSNGRFVKRHETRVLYQDENTFLAITRPQSISVVSPSISSGSSARKSAIPNLSQLPETKKIIPTFPEDQVEHTPFIYYLQSGLGSTLEEDPKVLRLLLLLLD